MRASTWDLLPESLCSSVKTNKNLTFPLCLIIFTHQSASHPPPLRAVRSTLNRKARNSPITATETNSFLLAVNSKKNPIFFFYIYVCFFSWSAGATWENWKGWQRRRAVLTLFILFKLILKQILPYILICRLYICSGENSKKKTGLFVFLE